MNNVRTIIIAAVIGIVISVIIINLFDYTFNGMFSDWLYNNYIYTTYYTDETTGVEHSVTQIDWLSIKTLLISLLFLAAIIVCTIIAVATSVLTKRRTDRAIKEISSYIQNYMDNSNSDISDFSEQYSEIAALIVKIKSDMLYKEQLTKAEIQKKNELIAYLAHDLKTPLTSVIGYLSLLDEAPDIPEKQRRKYINIALEKSNRLEKLINEFFEITRYNLNQMIIEKETVDLYYLMVQLTDEFYPLLNEHKNSIEIKMDKNLTVYGDAEKLARVFNNILKNAVYYSYTNTVIEISAFTENGHTNISFTNKGKTISKSKLDAVFEKFFRLDDARNTNTGGAGLGLAIAKEIVNLHGGTITAESENEITVFTINIPNKS